MGRRGGLRDRGDNRPTWVQAWFLPFLLFGLLGVAWLYQGKVVSGIVGISGMLLGGVLIDLLAPRRWPDKPIWKLTLPLQLLFVLAALFACVEFDIARQLPGGWWQISFTMAVFIVPTWFFGTATWRDSTPSQDEKEN